MTIRSACSASSCSADIGKEIFELDGSSTFVAHRQDDSSYIPAKRIHRIVELFGRECWTITLPKAWEQHWG